MPSKEPDKVQREIEELLDRLDNFVPEERLRDKLRNKRKVDAGPNIVERAWQRVSRLTLGHAMLAGIVLLIAGTVFNGPLGAVASVVIVAGLVLAVGAFVLSLVNGDSRRTIAGGRPQKRWRGQVIDYSEPSAGSRLREWWRRRRQ